MARTMSPQHYTLDGDYADSNFTADIMSKMQVPKRIKVIGNSEEDFEEIQRNPWQPDKIDMRVPDRILLAGQDRHMEAPAPPHELVVENSIMPPDPGLIRVQTPPRSITLDEHYFPSVVDDSKEDEANDDMNSRDLMTDQQVIYSMNQSVNPEDLSVFFRNSNDSLMRGSEFPEIVHLRKQMLKLNRRVLHVERELVIRQQREKLFFGFAAIYVAMKIFIWLNKTS